VKKKNDKWRMCVDYTGLNKACPKDPFPLPCIDQVMDSTAGCETLCFLNAYSGYHQIAMDSDDNLPRHLSPLSSASATASCLSRVKNAGATFQRCMQRVFGELIGQLVEAYVDDIVEKSK
jgi:hypothetical protein